MVSLRVGACLPLFAAACASEPEVDPWDGALGAFQEARATSPDYTTDAYDPVLKRLDRVPVEHPHRDDAVALARVLRTERTVVERTGLELASGPETAVEVERVETEVRTATGTSTTSRAP